MRHRIKKIVALGTVGIIGTLGVMNLYRITNHSSYVPNPSPVASAPISGATSGSTPGQCQFRDNGNLPDPVCTPGSLNSNVTQANIHSTICVSGYTSTIRPPTSYTNPLKLELMKQYGIGNQSPSTTELDHLVALELGGHPTDRANLWPEQWNGTYGAHAKDRIENILHTRVCNGTMTLTAAQTAIMSNWENIQ